MRLCGDFCCVAPSFATVSLPFWPLCHLMRAVADLRKKRIYSPTVVFGELYYRLFSSSLLNFSLCSFFCTILIKERCSYCLLYTAPVHKQAEWTLHPKPPSELLHASPAQLHKLTSVRESYPVAAVTKCARLLWIWLLTWSRLHASAFLRPNVLPIAFTYRR